MNIKGILITFITSCHHPDLFSTFLFAFMSYADALLKKPNVEFQTSEQRNYKLRVELSALEAKRIRDEEEKLKAEIDAQHEINRIEKERICKIYEDDRLRNDQACRDNALSKIRKVCYNAGLDYVDDHSSDEGEYRVTITVQRHRVA